MNQIIKFIGSEIVMVFTWMEDGKVWVKYFRNGTEIENWSELSINDQQCCIDEIESFKFRNRQLTIYAY